MVTARPPVPVLRVWSGDRPLGDVRDGQRRQFRHPQARRDGSHVAHGVLQRPLDLVQLARCSAACRQPPGAQRVEPDQGKGHGLARPVVEVGADPAQRPLVQGRGSSAAARTCSLSAAFWPSSAESSPTWCVSAASWRAIVSLPCLTMP